jgi:hypothetical protein
LGPADAIPKAAKCSEDANAEVRFILPCLGQDRTEQIPWSCHQHTQQSVPTDTNNLHNELCCIRPEDTLTLTLGLVRTCVPAYYCDYQTRLINTVATGTAFNYKACPWA